jgi:hypothetical protein
MSKTDVVKQENNKANRTPKTTFADRPQDINRNGRPKKEHCLTDLLKEALDQEHNETGKTKKQMIIDKMYELANEGDVAILKYMFDRIDGKPLQQIETKTIEEEVDLSRYSEQELKQLAELNRKARS